MNKQNKYIRWALGIPVFCIGISGWLLFDQVFANAHGFLEWSIRLINIIGCTAVGLWLLDVPTVNTTTINIK